MMLWVRASVARKSSTSAMSMPVCAPTETTDEKPTALFRPQSSMAAVSAPDCDTSASGPSAASGPMTPAFRCSCGRCSPRLLGPSSAMPSRRAMALSATACSGPMPVPTISAERQAMRPASSSAAVMSCGGSAITARSARALARSASVPLVWMSRKCSVPSKCCARSASCSKRAWRVSVAGSSARPANTPIDSGQNSGVR